MKTIVIFSGGLDSVLLAYKIAAGHDLFGLLSFDFPAVCARQAFPIWRFIFSRAIAPLGGFRMLSA